MSRVLTNEKNYYDIADTIRQMKEVNTTYKPREMSSALKDIYSNEVEGVLPLSFESNGMPLIDYRIDGASGGVGEKTQNLLNYNTVSTGYRVLWGNGDNYNDDSAIMSDYIMVDETNTYTCNINVFIIGYDLNYNYLGAWNGETFVKEYPSLSVKQITIPQTCSFIKILTFNSSLTPTSIDNLTMLNRGNIELPYEPYGYKVPVVITGKNLSQPINEWESGYLNISGTVSSANVERKEITSPFVKVNPNETYAFSFYPNEGDAWRCAGYYTANKEFISRKFASTTSDPIIFTTPANVELIRLSYRTYGDGTYAQLEQNSEVTTYETYHEPTTTNIYLDSPIEAEESISLSDREEDIETIEGTNTLTIDTTVQPSNVYIQAPKDHDEIVYLTTVLEEGI